MAHITITQWIKQLAKEQDDTKRRREQILFDVATYVLGRAKEYAKQNFTGRGPGKTARTKGRSGSLMRSIQMARLGDTSFVVTAGGPGVPYARVHELGTVGKGGVLPTIVPKPPRKYLTIPLLGKYVGRRATEFDLNFFKSKNGKFAFLSDNRGNLAYLLLKRVDIPARPYLEPAAKDVGKQTDLMARVAILYGTSKLPYKVTKI